jgi:hypothetical protein
MNATDRPNYTAPTPTTQTRKANPMPTTTRKRNPNELQPANPANKTTWKKFAPVLAHVIATTDTSDERARAAARRLHREYSIANGGGSNPYQITDGTEIAKTSHNPTDAGALVRAALGVALIVQSVTYMASARRCGLINACPHSTPLCRLACLGHTSGRLVMDNSKRAQIIRARFMIEHPREWWLVLTGEARDHATRAQQRGGAWLYRPNGATEFKFDQVPGYAEGVRNMAPNPSRVYLQDYAKRDAAERAKNLTPQFWHLAPSASERTRTADQYEPYMAVAVDIAPRRGNTPAEPLPHTFMGRPVIDGDATATDPTKPLGHGDMRLLDPITHPVTDPALAPLILLRAKGDVAQAQQVGPQYFVKNARHLVPELVAADALATV